VGLNNKISSPWEEGRPFLGNGYEGKKFALSFQELWIFMAILAYLTKWPMAIIGLTIGFIFLQIWKYKKGKKFALSFKELWIFKAILAYLTKWPMAIIGLTIGFIFLQIWKYKKQRPIIHEPMEVLIYGYNSTIFSYDQFNKSHIVFNSKPYENGIWRALLGKPCNHIPIKFIIMDNNMERIQQYESLYNTNPIIYHNIFNVNLYKAISMEKISVLFLGHNLKEQDEKKLTRFKQRYPHIRILRNNIVDQKKGATVSFTEENQDSMANNVKKISNSQDENMNSLLYGNDMYLQAFILFLIRSSYKGNEIS
jgi:hypothetical protein